MGVGTGSVQSPPIYFFIGLNQGAGAAGGNQHSEQTGPVNFDKYLRYLDITEGSHWAVVPTVVPTGLLVQNKELESLTVERDGRPCRREARETADKWNFRHPGEDEQMQPAPKAGKAPAYRSCWG